MKFLCDRCKTRYSIGDDRVRGKILKIRCKNCANVITVREGMSDVDTSDPQGLRKRGTTQAVPVVTASTGVHGDASAASAAPPPALEQEWYVSIDGAQEGPFTLAEAQAWVGARPYDAELHCWSEGFDDWLPVDKVSHFRGLRKKPAPAPTPPPLPRAATKPVHVTPTPRAAEPEPKPLFAATMASLERASQPSAGGFGMPAPIANGTQAPAPSTAKTAKGPGVGAAAKLPSFDLDSALDSATSVGGPSFDEPAAAANDLFAKSMGVSQPAPRPVGTPSPAVTPTLASSDLDDDDDEDDDLAIGEVSRVVNLADLKPRPKPQPEQPAMAAGLNRTGSVPRLGNTAAVPRLGNTAAVPRVGGFTAGVPRIDDPNAPLAPVAGDSMVAPQVASSHRRAMLLLIGAAAAVVIGGIIAVVLIVFGGDDGSLGGLGRGNDIDTTRPDDPLRKFDGDTEGSGSGSQTTAQTGPVIKKPNTGGSTRPQTNVTPKDPDPPVGGDRLGSDEIETMARTNSSGTQRCYMRAQRGAEAILIGDVRKVLATLTIAPDGRVTSVTLDKHSDNSFGKCLISMIGAWKFRASPGGTYRLTLAFAST